MNAETYQKLKKDFTAWAKNNSHNMLVSFPKSGRNYLGILLRSISGKIVINGIPEVEEHPYEDVFIFVCHRGRWDITGNHGKHIFLVRDPRDAILSRTYRKSRETTAISVPELLNDEDWLMRQNINEWEKYFEILLPHNPLIIQYEQLCLDPERTVQQILDFLGTIPSQDISLMVQNYDAVKPDPHKDKELIKAEFLNGHDRYNVHCLKWQKDKYITQAFLDRVWETLGNRMIQYGYSETGHSDRLFNGISK